MLRRNRKAVALVVVFFSVSLLAAAALASAVESGRVVLTRPGHSTRTAPRGPSELFTAPGAGNRDYCEGWCNNSMCECWGTYDCCLAGCNWCWDTFFPM